MVCSAGDKSLYFYSLNGELVGQCPPINTTHGLLLEISKDIVIVGANTRPASLVIVDMKAVRAAGAKKQQGANTPPLTQSVPTEHRPSLRALRPLHDGSFVVIGDADVFVTRWRLNRGETARLERIQESCSFFSFFFFFVFASLWWKNSQPSLMP
jgi:hypothetical protein